MLKRSCFGSAVFSTDPFNVLSTASTNKEEPLFGTEVVWIEEDLSAKPKKRQKWQLPFPRRSQPNKNVDPSNAADQVRKLKSKALGFFFRKTTSVANVNDPDTNSTFTAATDASSIKGGCNETNYEYSEISELSTIGSKERRINNNPDTKKITHQMDQCAIGQELILLDKQEKGKISLPKEGVSSDNGHQPKKEKLGVALYDPESDIACVLNPCTSNSGMSAETSSRITTRSKSKSDSEGARSHCQPSDSSVFKNLLTASVFKDDKSAITGIVLAKSADGKMIVSEVVPGGLFSKTTLRERDEILTINNRKVKGMNDNDAAQIIRESEGMVTVLARRYDQWQDTAQQLNGHGATAVAKAPLRRETGKIPRQEQSVQDTVKMEATTRPL